MHTNSPIFSEYKIIMCLTHIEVFTILQHLNDFLIVKLILTCLQELPLFLKVGFRRANDAVTQWNSIKFVFLFEHVCKCRYIDDWMQEIEPGLLNQPSFLYDSYLLRAFEDGGKFS